VCGLNPKDGCGWAFPPCLSTACTPAQCGAEPTIAVDCNGNTLSPVCQSDANGNCGWIVPPCILPGGAIDAGASP
jgi:hypothetical protein